MQQPPLSVNGGEVRQTAVRHPGPPVTQRAMPPPQFPPTPGKPGGYIGQTPGMAKMGGRPMNGPPTGPPAHPSLRGPDPRRPLVNGQPALPSGPPAGPPPRPTGTTPNRPYLPAPAAPTLKPPSPNPTTTMASPAPLLNGYQRPSPPINLTAPSGSTSTLNEGPHPGAFQPHPTQSLIGQENSRKMSPRVSPRMSPVPTNTSSSVIHAPVNGAPTTVPHPVNTVSSEPSLSEPQSNISSDRTARLPHTSGVNVSGAPQGHPRNKSLSGNVPASVSGHTSVAPGSTPQVVKPPYGVPKNVNSEVQVNSAPTPTSHSSGPHFSTTSQSGTSQIVPPSPVNVSSAPVSPAIPVVSQQSAPHVPPGMRLPPSSTIAPPPPHGSQFRPSGPLYSSPATMGPSPVPSGHQPPVRPLQPPFSSPALPGPPQTRLPTSMASPLPMGSSPMHMGPPTSMRPPPPTSMGPPQMVMGAPPTSIGPPATLMGHHSSVRPPLPSMGGPLQTSVGGLPSLGPPPPPSMGVPPSMGPPTSMGVPPPTSMGGPPSMGGPMPTYMGGPPSMGPPPTSMGGPMPTHMGGPSSVGPPPTSMGGPMPTPIGGPPSMGPSPTSAGYRPPVGPPPTGNTMAAPHHFLPKGHVQQQLPGQVAMPQYPVQQQQQYSSSGSANMNQLSQQLGGLSVTRDGWNKGWGTQQINLLQNRQILPPDGVVPPKPNLAQEYLPNCSPDVFRCTLTKVPETKSVLQKSRLPFGILIHPFKDLEHLPVVSCNTIVRCRSCRTYINPFVVFKGERRWECNLCFRVNELPEEFQYDPVSRTYGDPSRRPEVREATIEFIAPQEYMLRPPQPATYLWVLDVSRQAVDTGYLKVVCDTLLTQLDKIPGDRRTMIGFITFSSNVQFYLMGEEQKHVQMLEVGEVEDVFVPNPDDLLVNLEQSRTLVEEFLAMLPEAHGSSYQTQSALGTALQAAYKLLSPIGGRITIMTTTLPTMGPGALKPREDPNQRAGKDTQNMGPATDFYKKLALDCSGQQIAVDLFALNSQYVDLATLTGISKFSGGCIHHFPNFHVARNPASVTPFINCLTRYITRKIGFEAVMRIRATRGLTITNFHGNFFVRSTDLLSLPNINPDAGFGMQVNIEEPLHNIRTACFQAALLYTSSRGERRIRVHTLCLPVCPNQHEIVTSGDQQAVVALLSKMAVDRCLSSSLSDARDALVNASIDALTSYKVGLSNPAHGALEAPPGLQLLPLFVLAVVKSIAFRGGLSTKLDDRLFAMCELKSMPLKHLMTFVYPDLYPIHTLSEKGALHIEDQIIPQPGRLHLSAERLERAGAYLMDSGTTIFIYVRSGVSAVWVEATLGVPSYAVIPQPLYEDALPDLDTPESTLLRNFVSYLQRNKPYQAPVVVLKEDNPARMLFIQHLVDDRTEGSHSYVEFLQFLKTQIK